MKHGRPLSNPKGLGGSSRPILDLETEVRPKPPAEPIDSPLKGNQLEGGLRSNGMPPEGFANPVTSDKTEFCSNTPVSELIERVTRAVKANDVNSTLLLRKLWMGR